MADFTGIHRQWTYDRFNTKIITPPTFEHITLDEARDHLRIIPFGSPAEHEEDTWITTNITVAREWCEWWSGTAFCVQTLELGLMNFPVPFSSTVTDATTGALGPRSVDSSIMLPMGFPLISVDAVSYDDGSGGVGTLGTSAYYINDYERPARIYPAPGTSWPTAQAGKTNAVRIRYTCGFSRLGDSPTVGPTLPLALKAAMLLILGHLHENRENTSEIAVTEIPLGAASLMERYRCRLSMA